MGIKDEHERAKIIGQFEDEAKTTVIDGHVMIAAWDDGVMLSTDNGLLVEGKQYRITIEEI